MKGSGLPFPMRLLNTVGRLTPADRIDRFRLDKATVMQEAMSLTGLNDFGHPFFEEGLDALLASIEQDIEVHLVGQMALRRAIVDGLANRLLLAHEQQRRPEIFRSPLRPPIIVTGLHRSGTTHLHRLLAQDPKSHAPPYWQLITPIASTRDQDTRRQRARHSLALRTRLMPDLSRMHTMDVDSPEECFYLTASSFESVFYWSMAPVTGYLRWYLDRDRGNKYREYRSWLQVLQQQNPSQRLVLKAPEHLGALDALLDAIPEAHIVQIHRNPMTSFASYLSMAKTTHALTVPHLDDARTAEASLDLFVSDLRSNRLARKSHPTRIHDVDYSNLIDDPIGTISAIYDHLAVPVSPGLISALTAYSQSHRAGRHGKHHYNLDDAPIDVHEAEQRLTG